MKTSELIKLLQDAMEKYGDLKVLVHDGMDPSDPELVKRVTRYDFDHIEIEST